MSVANYYETPSILSVRDAHVMEGKFAKFIVKLDKSSVHPTYVNLSLGEGSAKLGQDFTGRIVVVFGNGFEKQVIVNSGVVEVPAGVTKFVVRVKTRQDSIVENDETFTLTASTKNGPSRTGTATIKDDDFVVSPDPAHLRGEVFFDENSNGIQDPGESLASGIRVALTGAGGDGVLGTGDDTTISTETDGNGQYSFNDLNPGEPYKVTFSNLPEGFMFTEANVGGDDTIDSDVDPDSGMTQSITLTPGETRRDLDAGLKEIVKPNIDPHAEKDSAWTYKRQAVKIDVLSNDTDSDGDTLFLDSFSQGSNGTVTRHTNGTDNTDDDTLTYTPNDGFKGTDSFSYSISDGKGGTDTATVHVDVQNRAPHAGNVYVQTGWANAFHEPGVRRYVDFNIFQNRSDPYYSFHATRVQSKAASDPDGDNLTVHASSQWADIGDLHYLGGGSFRWFTNTNGNYGVRNFSYSVSDGHDKSTGNIQVYVTPIAVDLNGDGIQTLSVNQGVKFDILNLGKAVNTGWVSGKDALLAVDNDGDGLISSRSELVGGANIGDGFAKLASFDSNQDGVVNASDALFDELKLWQDANENGITDAGELVSLESMGITDLNTSYENQFTTDKQGNIHGEVGTAIRHGQMIEMTDLYFQVNT